MDKTEHEIRRGERAAALLGDDLLSDAFTTIEREYTKQWIDSPARDAEGREKLYLMVKTVQRLRLELQSVMETGQIAKATLAERVGRTLSRFS